MTSILSRFSFAILAAALFSACPCGREVVRLAYCPTMEPYVLMAASDHRGVSPVLFDSAGNALAALRSGAVDAAMIGRMARAGETDGSVRELRILDGQTLVARVQRTVRSDDLRTMRIHTALPEDIVSNLLPESANIVFHLSSGEALREGLGEAVLIDWRDYDDSFGLVIPMRGEAKDGRFRAPVLYYRSGLARETAEGIARSVRKSKP